jgi:hypothetical protein
MVTVSCSGMGGGRCWLRLAIGGLSKLELEVMRAGSSTPSESAGPLCAIPKLPLLHASGSVYRIPEDDKASAVRTTAVPQPRQRADKQKIPVTSMIISLPPVALELRQVV